MVKLLEIIWVRSEKKERFRKNEFPEIVDWIEPENQIKKRKLPKNLLNIEDINKLAEATKNNRNRAIVLFLYETGCRIGELLELKIDDVEFDKYGARITIPIEGKTGNRKIRVVSCSPALLIWLKEHPTKNDTTSPLFCGIWSKKIGMKLNYDYVRLMLKDLFKETGINKPSNPHHFRHSRASELANTLTESQLCHYMGWVQGSKEARTYVHLSGRDLDKDVLQMYGIDITVEDKKTEFKPKTCPRCGVINDPASTYCTG
jgi:integrase